MKVRACIYGAILLAVWPCFSVFSEEFVPGSEVIRESDILRRMEEEIGQTRAEKKTEPAKTEAVSNPQITVVTGAGTQKGNSILSQNEIVILPEGGLPLRIPIREVAEVTFLKWSVRAAADRRYFFPSVCKVRKRDGSEITGRLHDQDWLRLDVGGASVLSYFVSANAAEEIEAQGVPAGVVRRFSFEMESESAGR